MKLSPILFKQHIGRYTRSLWYVQGKITPWDTQAEKILKERGFEVINPNDIVTPKRKLIDFKDFDFLRKQPLPENETHPDWHDRPCLVYGDNDLLVEGLPQAQLITNTIVIENELPEAVEQMTKDINIEIHKLVERIAKSSVIFDSYQQKLPIIKDPLRPAWVFPRAYGLTELRKVTNLSRKLLQLCDCVSGPEIANTRSIIDNALMTFPFEKDFDLYNFSLTMDLALMSDKPLQSVGYVNTENSKLPSLHPIHHAAGLFQNNIYKLEDKYPLISSYHKKNVHTIFIYYDSTTVKNLTEIKVTETQIYGRALLKAFVAAASTARQKFGNDVKELPEPITIQCIQSDGKAFYFSVYQLNTLNIDGEEGVKNYCWTLPKLSLYETGSYVEGKPTFEGYNPEVFKRILAFYKNN